MRAGKMRRRVIIEQSTPTRNSIGGEVDVWAPVATVAAEIQSKGGREFDAAKQRNATLTHLVRIRYMAGLTSKMRINHGGRFLDIQSVVDVGVRRRTLMLMCVENVSVSAVDDTLLRGIDMSYMPPADGSGVMMW